MINSALAKQNATDKDPWAVDWLKNNKAGRGAYRVKKWTPVRNWTPGQELAYQRFDDWKAGPLPKIERVIWATVPSPSNRRAHIERGDVDISSAGPPAG